MVLGMGGIVLRDYQEAAVAAIQRAHADGVRRPAVVLPTGTGKTVVFSELVRREQAAGNGRTLVLAHRTELIQQAAAKIRDVAPDLRVGIVQADSRQHRRDVIVASVPTLATLKRRSEIAGVGLVIVDECHHATAPTYMKILEHYGCFGDGARAVGFTATMTRADEKALSAVWEDVVYTRSIAQAIMEGHLVRPRGVRVQVPDLSLKRVRKSRGDYVAADLGTAIEGSMAPELVAKAYAEHAPGKPGILFAPTVATAELYAEGLRSVGITAAVVSGTTPAAERARMLADFSAGRVQVLCNCAVLTEGTDLPLAEVCVVGRPTKSQGLYVQMVGRVLRPYPGKHEALVLDITGATERHSLMGSVDLFGEERPEPGSVDEIEDDRDEWELFDDLKEAQERGDVDDDEQIWLEGPIESREVDLFRARESMWMRTYGGIWFIPAGDRYIIVQPTAPGAEGHWDVIEMHKFQVGRSSWVATGVSDLGYAMAFAEGNVQPAEMMTAKRNARWRKNAASDKQRALAARYGLALSASASSGEAAEAITVAMASARIDRLVPAYARRRA